MTIQWFTPNTVLPTLTVASYGITFNSGALDLLKGFSSVRLGCDPKNKVLLIELHKESNSSGFSIPEINENTKNVRITCREFVQFLQVKCKIDVSNPVKFFIQKSGENRIEIDLSTFIPSNKTKKTKAKES
ncbi:hypothetical protein [Brevibacillus brevis]|uniref:hypothetical protein n=1 Tax=Brevibacillus brevis TaxID=1393 RepID=UPI000D10B8BC|nr:hypothetical protein [Brevibacillus brevis]PSJ63548.1 hypothetical protein C7J99_31310 [Brevibacillus brevis]RED33845.1 hypothetical protein DES34_10210 [Brevibacillus brevis]GEC93336.1 hypothetical protein BBR01nite_56670 [Brevibacillus brevis]VEF92585.1 Uncharacterised protein [Brevibacillus brevis]